jgi:hypothetical protein
MQKHFLFVSSFEHVNFAINKKYSKKHYDNPNYCLVRPMCEVHSIASPIQRLCLFFTCCLSKIKKSSEQPESTSCKTISKLRNKSQIITICKIVE